MHSTFFLTLLFIDAAVNCGLLPSNKAEELVQDGNNDVSKIAVDDGKGAVKLIGRGYVDLVVSSDSIFVGVNLDKCNGKVLFFYAAKSGKMMEAAKNLCRAWPGSCGFQLKGTSDNITFTRDTFTKSELVDCKNDVEIKMKYNYAKYCNRGDASCTAVISPEDGRIGIHVEYTSNECPVTIKYAKIYVPPTTTLIPSTALPSMAKSSNGTITKNEDSAADASSQQLTWIILGCLIGVIVLGLIGGILLCRFKKWCMFKKKAAETLPPPVESIVSTTVTTKADENVTQQLQRKKKVLPAPPPPSAVPSTKPPSPAMSAKKPKEKKGMTSPATAATPSKKAPKEKKPTPAPPGKMPAQKQPVPAPSAEKKVSKEATKSEKQPSATQSYSPPFCLLPVRVPSPPPRKPLNPEHLEHRRRGGKKDSLELPSFSGGKPVYSQYAREKQQKEKAAEEAWKKKLRNEKAAAAKATKKKKGSQKK